MPDFKNRHAPLFVVLALAVACAGIWAHLLAPHATSVADIEPRWLEAALSTAPPSASRVAAIVGAQPAELLLLPPAQTSGCAVRGPLPDVRCTPGAVFATAGTSTICVAGYTKGVRSVSTKQKRIGYAAYGVVYPQKTGTYEYDHLIPLELGGNNDQANLFPEAAATGTQALGFKEKDVVEDYLHDEVCRGDLNLAQAQEQIAQDWTAVYKALDSATISQIKQQYHSWAD